MKARNIDDDLDALKKRLKESEERLALAEQKLKQQEERYQSLFYNLSDEVHLWKVLRDNKGVIKTWELVDLNPAALCAWKKEKADVIGKTADEIFGTGATEQFMAVVQKIISTGKTLRWIEYFEPTNQYLSMSSIPMGEYFISTGKDITEEKLTEKALKESEEFLKRTGEIAKIGGWQLYGDFKEVHHTKTTTEIHEVPEDAQLSTEEAINFYHPDHRDMVAESVTEALEKGKPFEFEARFTTAKGNNRWVLARGEAEMVDGKCERLFGVFQDITERKNAEIELAESEEKFKSIFRDSSVAKIIANDEGRYIEVNTKACELLGYTREELTSLEVEDVVYAKNQDPRMLYEKLRQAGTDSGEIKILRKDGELRTVEYYAKRIGRNRHLSTLIDVTEKRKSEHARKVAEEHLQHITNSVPGTIYQFRLHADGGYSMPFLSARAKELLGFGYEKMKDAEFLFSRIHPEDYESTMSSILSANHNNAIWNHEFRAINSQGQVVWIRGSSCGLVNENGDVVHNGVFLDITKSKEAEEALKRSQQQYLNTAQNLPGVVLKYKLNTDGSDELLYISPGVKGLYGVGPLRAMANNQLLWDQIHKDDLQAYRDSIKESASSLSPWKFEHRIRFPDGSIKWVDMRGIPTKESDGSIIWDSIGLDITKRKKAEKELEQINANLELLVEERAQKAIKLSKELELYWLAAEHAKSGVWRYDLRTHALEWDTIMYELYGLREEDFVGAYEAWESSLHPEDREHAIRALDECIARKTDFDTNFRIIHPQTLQVTHIRGKGKLELDEQGNAIAVYGTNWDVSKEMQLADEREAAINKLKETQSQLVQSEKMASLGILTAGVAHELNNPINYIVGGYTAIQEHLDEGVELKRDEIQECLDWIKAGSGRASDIVKSLNLFSRSNEDVNEECAVHQIIDDCLLMLNNKHKGRIEVSKHYSSNPLMVLGNNGKLHQAFLNLLSNAMDAIAKEGEIVITTKVGKRRQTININDTGSGIPKEHLKKVMDPFYTTKPPGKGTGLGLSITHAIIQDHKGSLQLQSTLGAGTLVKISFPK